MEILRSRWDFQEYLCLTVKSFLWVGSWDGRHALVCTRPAASQTEPVPLDQAPHSNFMFLVLCLL